MAYKIKKAETRKIAKNLKFNFFELDEKARQIYGTDFMDLGIKEQDEISRMVAEGFHYKILN